MIFDTETTGFIEPQCIELAVTDAIPQPTDDVRKSPLAHSWRFKATKPIDLAAMAAHHIIAEDIAQYEPYEPQRCPAFSDIRRMRTVGFIIGHNVDFDWLVIGKPEYSRICTLALARFTWPEIDSRSLSALMFHLLPHRDARDIVRSAHSAPADVVMTWALVTQLIRAQRARGVPLASWAEVYELSEKARVPTMMTFGKHKGTLIAQVPRDYKDWLLRQDDLDPYLVRALQAR